ncbi:serine acetyltransferase [Tepiditoga spiralis]|uniref:Serine acetyltransferase n=1 Tax=Tepiditoga spiralis TaxID=2108365 RepID=A0A7G1G9I7_9BACT|nr:serine O-acetyltransferase EpsC [Tepiditoga spiralis]BBE31894.1 serine acetyltransferase [Tepiditoga spiralis]
MIKIIKDFFHIFRSINKDLNEFIKKDPIATSKLKIFFISTSLHGLISYRFYSFFHKYKIYILSYPLYVLSKILYSMDIHPSAQIDAGVVIDHGIGVVIGETAKIGSGTLIYHGVTLGAKKVMKGKRHPEIGKNVTIGAGAKVLGNIIIGDDVVIGSNSVVLMDIPRKSLVVGIPAKIKKFNCNASKMFALSENTNFVI